MPGRAANGQRGPSVASARARLRAVSYRSPFSRRLLREMMSRRALLEQGDRAARTSPLWPGWRSNLHPRLLPEAEGLVDTGALPLHDYAHALNSSQAFAMNLFLPLRLGRSAPFEELLGQEFGFEVEVEGADLEFIGSGDLLAEIPGAEPREHDKLTAADVAIHLRDREGRAGVLLVEVKLSEGGFTPCGGIDSRGNRDRAPCLDAGLFFEDADRCYLRRPYRASRDRRYWSIFRQAHGSLRAAFPGAPLAGGCPFAGDWQQPMRNHALALAMEQDDRVSFWRLALVHHDGNPDVCDPWDAYTQGTVDSPHIYRWAASELLAALGAATGDAAGHASWMRAKYVLDEELP